MHTQGHKKCIDAQVFFLSRALGEHRKSSCHALAFLEELCLLYIERYLVAPPASLSIDRHMHSSVLFSPICFCNMCVQEGDR